MLLEKLSAESDLIYLSFFVSQASYVDFSVDLKPAHDCMMKKCKEQWDACPDSGPETRSYHTRDFLEVRDIPV